MTTQTQEVSEYERKKPTFEWHKALIKQILLNDPTAHNLQGLTDDQVAKRLELRLREENLRKHGTVLLGRKTPTTDNRLREMATDKQIVRIKGLDGLKHNFHPDIFQSLDKRKLRNFFPETELTFALEEKQKDE